MGRLESDFKSDLVEDLEEMFPDCILLWNDANRRQGIPDLLILWESKWAFLEVKRDAKAAEQPNQRYYVNLAHEWSFGAFIFPENKEEVLSELQRTFKARRSTRISVRQ